MTEGWCGALLAALVPLVAGLNAAALFMLGRIRSELSGDDSPRREP